MSQELTMAKLRSCEREADISRLNKNIAEQNLKIHQSKLFKTKFTYANVSSNIQFYTGIINDIFKMIVSSVKSWPSKSLLSLEYSLLITLMRVRLACPSKDLALRFNVAESTVSKTIANMLHVLRYV